MHIRALPGSDFFSGAIGDSIILNTNIMIDSRYKKLPKCTLEELADMVDDLENMSIHALKEKKLSMRRLVLTQIHEVKKEIEKRLKK